MGVMEKMRNSTASILWILIFSFGVLWVLADTQVFDALAVGPQNLGEVNGDPISLEEYNQRVSYYNEQFNRQTSRLMTTEERAQYEQQAWDDLVAARLFEQKMNDLGISVTDSELVDMITGDNPVPFIRQQFQQEDGTIDRIALRAAIEAPENREVWMMVEQQLRDTRRQEKMGNFISSGLRASNTEIRNEFKRENSFADFSFVRFPYSEIGEDEIEIDESELRDYLRNNPDDFKRAETYRFRYVSWSTEPTARDTSNTIRDVENLRGQFADAVNDSLFLLRNQSATQYSGNYVAIEDLQEEHRVVLDLEPGEVSDVVMIDGDPHIFKKTDQRGQEVRYSVLSYNVVADPVGTLDRLAEQAREFEFYASEDGFEREAERRELEVRTATATKGSPFVPGIGQSSQLLRELERMRVNRISDPIETPELILVIQLLEKTPEGTRPFNEVRNQIENIVRYEKRIEIMRQRVNEMLNAGTTLEELAEATDKEVQSVTDVRLGSNNIPAAGREPQVIGAVFSLTPGERSNAISGQNAAFVVVVNDVAIANPDEMSTAQRSQIRQRIEQQKMMAFNQVFIEQLKNDARIRDNRSQILR